MGDALGYAWAAFTKHIAALVVLALVLVGVQVVLRGIDWLIDRGAAADSALVAVPFSIASLMFGVLAWLISLLLAIGLIRAALAVLDGREPTPNLLFLGEGLPVYVIASVLFALGTLVGFVFCLIPGIVLAFLWQFYGYAIVDGGRDVGATTALGRSYQVVKSNVGELLVMWLAFFGISLAVGLGSIIPVIGWIVAAALSLVVFPVFALSIAYAWRALTGGRITPIT